MSTTPNKKGKTSKQDISVLSLPFPGIRSYFHVICFKKTKPFPTWFVFILFT